MDETELEPIFVTIRTGCRIVGIKPTKMYELIGAKAVESVKLGGRRLLKYQSLKRLGAPQAPEAA